MADLIPLPRCKTCAVPITPDVTIHWCYNQYCPHTWTNSPTPEQIVKWRLFDPQGVRGG